LSSLLGTSFYYPSFFILQVVKCKLQVVKYKLQDVKCKLQALKCKLQTLEHKKIPTETNLWGNDYLLYLRLLGSIDEHSNAVEVVLLRDLIGCA